MTLSSLILAGGQSRRMGEDKALLSYDGRHFLDIIARELAPFGKFTVSVDSPERYPRLGYKMISDVYPHCGPLGGLHAALSECETDCLIAVSCDLPLFRSELGKALFAAMTPDCDAVVPKTSDGRNHPFCAVYSRRCAAVFEAQLKAGSYCMKDALDKLNVIYFKAGSFADMLTNINTPEEYASLRGKDKP